MSDEPLCFFCGEVLIEYPSPNYFSFCHEDDDELKPRWRFCASCMEGTDHEEVMLQRGQELLREKIDRAIGRGGNILPGHA